MRPRVERRGMKENENNSGRMNPIQRDDAAQIPLPTCAGGRASGRAPARAGEEPMRGDASFIQPSLFHLNERRSHLNPKR